MKNTRISEILYALRKQKKINQEQLCLGLCTKSTYSHYENGDRIPDRLLLHAFLQRMGKSGDRISAILSVEEYDYFNWRKKTLQFINQGDFERLQNLLENEDTCYATINSNLQKQYTLFLQAVLAEQTEHNIPKAIQLLQQALTLTIPGIGMHKLEDHLISAEEMSLFLTLASLFIQGNCRDDAFSLLSQMLHYIEHHYDDTDIKVKVFPATAKLFAPLLLEKQMVAECMLLCQKSIELLRWHGILSDMAELIEILLNCKSLLKPSDCLHLGKQLQALKEFYQEYHVETGLQTKYFLVYSNLSVYLSNEIISTHRLSKSLSQEELSEGICSPETLSRIESGKRTPNARNFHALMTKLDTNLDYYNEDIDTDNYWVLEKKMSLDRMLSL